MDVGNNSAVVGQEIITCDRTRTARLIDFERLVDELGTVAAEYAAGHILSPARMVVPLVQPGVLLSMPAVAGDICIHKLVNVQPNNRADGLPTIHGIVTVCDAHSGVPRVLLDGPEVTGRRTAAVSMLAIRNVLKSAPRQILIIGTGMQSRYHVQAIHQLFPDAAILVRGVDTKTEAAFCAWASPFHTQVGSCPASIPATVEVVVTLTTSTRPVYNETARPGRLVIGVGAFKPEMAEIGKLTLDGSVIYADDPPGARHEAGDLMRAGIDWDGVQSLAALLAAPWPTERPVVFKSVGTAAWDLAAGRVALRALKEALR